jgi:hypothetical protein
MTEQQAAGAVFVIRVIFNNHPGSNHLAYLLHRDSANDALVNGVFGELELPRGNLLANLLNHPPRHILFRRL